MAINVLILGAGFGGLELATLLSERLLLRAPRASDAAALRRLLVANADHLRPWSPAPSCGSPPEPSTGW